MEREDTLERKALRNTRALLDRLDTDEATRKRKQKTALLIIGATALAGGALLFLVVLRNPVMSDAEKRIASCEVDALSAIASARTEKLRAENPGTDFREISKKLKPFGDEMAKEARERCRNATAKQK
jgi:hypothetical protein